MKNLFASFAMLSVLFLFSCKKDDNNPVYPAITQKSQITSAKTADGYTVELLGDTNVLFTGYNKLYFRVLDASGKAVANATPEVTPLMDMTTMSHSTPHDAVQWNSSENLYSSAATFIMPTTPDGNWYLSVKIAGNTTKMPVTVKDYPTKVLNSAKGTDSVFYYAALVRPKAWTVGMNDITFAVYKRESMMDFPVRQRPDAGDDPGNAVNGPRLAQQRIAHEHRQRAVQRPRQFHDDRRLADSPETEAQRFGNRK